MNDTNPDYVVVGETKNYNYVMLETAVALVRKGQFALLWFCWFLANTFFLKNQSQFCVLLKFSGARLIGTNCDLADKSDDTFIPACGALIKPIELASGFVMRCV